MKRKMVLTLAVAIVALAAIFAAWQEWSHPTYTTQQTVLGAEQALAECPELALSEEEYAAGAQLLALPAVQAALGQDAVTLDTADAAGFAPCVPENAQITGFSVLDRILYLTYTQDEGKKETVLTFSDPEGALYATKTVAYYSGAYEEAFDRYEHADTIYENLDGKSFMKLEEKRVWFAWLPWQPAA